MRWYLFLYSTVWTICINIACNNITFGCKDQISCIDDGKRCDGIRDCKDGSDETGCSKSITYEFKMHYYILIIIILLQILIFTNSNQQI